MDWDCFGEALVFGSLVAYIPTFSVSLLSARCFLAFLLLEFSTRAFNSLDYSAYELQIRACILSILTPYLSGLMS